MKVKTEGKGRLTGYGESEPESQERRVFIESKRTRIKNQLKHKSDILFWPSLGLLRFRCGGSRALFVREKLFMMEEEEEEERDAVVVDESKEDEEEEEETRQLQ